VKRCTLVLAAALTATLLLAAGAEADTFNDPAGDANGSPDITTAAVSEQPGGILQFTVTALGISASDAAQAPEIDVFIDADQNPATGDPRDGTEYDLTYWRDPTDWGWDVARWNGTKWEEVPGQPTTMSFNRSGDTLSWRLSKDDLGSTTGFNFYAVSTIYDAAGNNILARDDAPDAGVWSYVLRSITTTTAPTPTKGSLRIGAPKTSPPKATAGKRFTVGFPVWETGGQPLKGTMTSTVSVGGKAIRRTEQYKHGTAIVSFMIPNSAHGKLVKVKLTIHAGSVTAQKIVTFRAI
jgi:hypothetical protein